MSIIMIVAAIVSWVACGVLAYGLTFAHLQREYPTIAEKLLAAYRHLAMEMAFLGPIGLAVTLVVDGCRHGLMFRSRRRKR